MLNDDFQMICWRCVWQKKFARHKQKDEFGEVFPEELVKRIFRGYYWQFSCKCEDGILWTTHCQGKTDVTTSLNFRCSFTPSNSSVNFWIIYLFHSSVIFTFPEQTDVTTSLTFRFSCIALNSFSIFNFSFIPENAFSFFDFRSFLKTHFPIFIHSWEIQFSIFDISLILANSFSIIFRLFINSWEFI